MHVFLRAQDYEIWKVMSNGPYTLLEDEGKWMEDNIKKSKINFSAMNIIQCAIHPDEYSCVSMRSSANEMWDKLKLIYEGTLEVKETKANILVHEYEMFKMSPVETISDMFARLSNITNGLKALGKNYTSSEIVTARSFESGLTSCECGAHDQCGVIEPCSWPLCLAWALWALALSPFSPQVFW
ncbi:hypothetical protein Taro_016086 [Colocasia esculenta]|uniref:UBN2 domain-containing protein n=1 Tax=Colocasia esculenta TaxID=4460 RepID=A0A843UV74_COLES|nr:hypothetical protein [Colocasia esculenta]